MNPKSNNEMRMIDRLKKDFEEFKGECRGILLFGSYAKEEPTKRSDIDVCMVKPLEGIFNGLRNAVVHKYNRLDLDAVQRGLNKIEVLYEVLDKLVEVVERKVFLEES